MPDAEFPSHTFPWGDTLDQTSSLLPLIIPQQSRDLHIIPLEKRKQEEGENKTKSRKPSCVDAGLVGILSDQE